MNIEKGSIQHLIILIVAIAISGMILYPIFDYVLCSYITNSDFVYSTHEYIVQPILYGAILGTVLWVTEKKSK